MISTDLNPDEMKLIQNSVTVLKVAKEEKDRMKEIRRSE